jgi:peptidyl-prolyl cis-trans isomerase B (cyclophilin B)
MVLKIVSRFTAGSLAAVGLYAALFPSAYAAIPQTKPSGGGPESAAGRQIAVLQTNKGVIKFELLPDLAPHHVANFVDLARSGFYDGTKFHRIIPGFMIQGGDPNTKTENKATWGSGNGPRRLKAEFSPAEKASHVRGMVSAARLGDNPDSASCQFFIVHKDSKFLDAQYSIFGRVVSGMEVVDDIADTPRDASDRPIQPMIIQKVTIETQ